MANPNEYPLKKMNTSVPINPAGRRERKLIPILGVWHIITNSMDMPIKHDLYSINSFVINLDNI